MKISSGIRQGCTGSTTLFKLVTFIIIREIKNFNHGFRNRKYFIPALFFADDGLLMAETKIEAEKMISKLNSIASECGLEVNKIKSHVLVFNKKENFNEIGNIETVESLKYLGVTISNHNDCFTVHKEYLINKAQKLANLMPAVIGRSSNRLLVGKTFWKGVALPKLLFSTTVIPMKQNFIQKLQSIENNALRKIFYAPKFTPNCALRGEIGISLMKTRLHKNLLNFTKHLLTSKNILVKNICETELEKNYSPWAKQVNKILFQYNLDTNILLKLTKNNINEGLKAIDNATWENTRKEKTSLKIYNDFKTEMKEEKIYNNSYASNLLFRCRTNTLILNERNRFTNQDTKCACGHERENLEHFLLHCKHYSQIRKKIPILQQPYEENCEPLLKKILLFEKETIKFQLEMMEYIKNIYSTRKNQTL